MAILWALLNLSPTNKLAMASIKDGQEVAHELEKLRLASEYYLKLLLYLQDAFANKDSD